MRQRLLPWSGLLAAVLLLQWAVGLAACMASMPARAALDLMICYADGTAPAPSKPPVSQIGGAGCPICLQLAATLLPEPPVAVPGPPVAYALAALAPEREGWRPARATPAHPARGPPALL